VSKLQSPLPEGCSGNSISFKDIDTPNGNLVGHKPPDTVMVAITNEHEEQDLLVVTKTDVVRNFIYAIKSCKEGMITPLINLVS
jgi:hypothetical protein